MMYSQENIFADFVGRPVKVPYLDGEQFKVARGTLEFADNGFVKIRGSLGLLIINEKNIQKMSEIVTNSRR